MSEENTEVASGSTVEAEATETGAPKTEEVELFGPPGDAAATMSLNDAFDKVMAESKEEPSESEEPEKPKETIQFGEVEVDAAQTVEINGEQVPVKELINDYHGRKEITRRFTEFDKSKKAWEQEVISKFKEESFPHAEAVRKIQEAAETGDYMSVFAQIAKLNGKSAAEAKASFVHKVLEMSDQFAEMSEDELKTWIAEEKYKEADEELKAKTDKEKREKVQAETQAKVKEVIQKQGLSDSQFAEAYSFLKQDEQIINQLKSLTPEQAASRVCQFYHDSLKEARIEKAVQEAAPDYEHKEELINKIFRVADYDYSVEDIKEVVAQVLAMTKKSTAETPSTEAAPKAKETPATPEKTNSSGISNLLNQEPEDELGWDFT